MYSLGWHHILVFTREADRYDSMFVPDGFATSLKFLLR